LTISTTQGKYICPVTTSKPRKVWVTKDDRLLAVHVALQFLDTCL